MGHWNGGGNSKGPQKARERPQWSQGDGLAVSGGEFRDLGEQAERDGELKSAFRLYEKALAADSASPENWFNYGRALLGEDRAEEAVKALSEALDRSATDLRIRYWLGRALSAAGRWDEATQCFTDLSEIDPGMDDPMTNMGLSFLSGLAICRGESGDWEKAFETMAPSLLTVGFVLNNLGDFSRSAGEYDRAGFFFHVGAMLLPGDFRMQHGAGWCAMKLGNLSVALEHLAEAVKLERRSADAWYDLGIVLSRMKKRGEARSCFERVRRIDRRHYWALYDLACLDALEKDAAACFRNLHKAVGLGFRDLEYMLADADFKSVRKDRRWKRIVAQLGHLRQDEATEAIEA